MNTKLTRCRTKLLLENAFFGTLALKLKPVAEQTDTMATDGYHLFYSEDFVNSTPENELKGVVCHELLHCAFLHMYRRNDRDPMKWNIACDHAINLLLVDNFNFELPAGGLLDRAYTNLSAEEIYNRLPENPKPPSWGTFIDGTSSETTGTTQVQEAEWTVATKQATAAAKAAGQNLGKLAELVESATAKVNWREQLNRLIGGHAKSDFSWLKPDPAYLYKNLIIPSLHAPSIGHLTFAIDTSASVSNEELAQFISELAHVLDNVHFDGLTVIECDTDIQKVTDYEPGDTIEPKVHGRGGTRFEPVFEYIKKAPTDGLIYFTDMEPSKWPKDPGIPTFWARTRGHDAPFGQYIDLYLNG